MNIDKQIKYWIDSSVSDLESAKILLDNGKYLHGLFWCHLSIEKAIKAHVVKYTKEIPPRSHDLLYLLKKSDLQLPEQQIEFLGLLMPFQLEGRYPDYNPRIPSVEMVNSIFSQTKTLQEWIRKKL
ncbi:MAG: HEPN domain-containing protein [Bacteroidetes bacterium]|jgi:HEPN domain-containing protein|nr:HEPN domain-containing protein [Bacteroidota bacterium]